MSAGTPASVHPALAGVLAMMSGDASRAAVDPRHKQYRELLERHDWHYEMADDHSAWKRGLKERAALMLLQPVLDPHKVIWALYAPKVMA